MSGHDETGQAGGEAARGTAGLRLGFALGDPARGAARAAVSTGEVPFRILVVGDFGAAADAAPQGLSLRGEVPADLAGQLGAAARFRVPNLLGSVPDPIAVELPIRRMSDFSAKTIGVAVEPLRRAGSLRAAVAGGLRSFESYADLDRLVAAIGPAQAPRRDKPAATASDVDRLLSMLDVAGAPPTDDVALPAGAGPKGAVGVIDALVTQQLASVRGAAALAALEAAWRGLRLLTGAGLPTGAEIDLVAVAGGQAPACLIRDIVPDELEGTGATRLGCILVSGAVPGNEDGLGQLALCAAAGAALQVPVIVSLAPDFFEGSDPLVEAGWQVLRADASAGWLAACLGDIVLGAEGRDAPLWGEPGWAVAALALASFRQYGWPNELANPSAMTLDGLEVHEVSGRGASAAWPLRRPVNRADTAALAGRGVLTLAAQANRDRVFLAAAPCLGAGVELGGQLVAARLLACLRAAGPLGGQRRGAEAVAATLDALLAGVGQVVGVRPGEPGGSEAGPWEVTVRLVSPARTILFTVDA